MGTFSPGPAGFDWNVGDKTDYKLKVSFLEGTMDILVREKQGNDYWIEQNIDIIIQKSKIEMLIDPDTGKIKAMIVDGQKKEPPKGGNLEIIETREDRITVPAGTFDTVYIKVRNTDDNSITEQWVNPVIIPVFGMAKMVQEGQFGEVVVELTGYNR